MSIGLAEINWVNEAENNFHLNTKKKIFILTRYKSTSTSLSELTDYNKLDNPTPIFVSSDLLLQIIIYIEYTTIKKYVDIFGKINSDKSTEDNTIFVNIKNKLLKTLFSSYDYGYSKTFINKEFCNMTKEIKCIIGNYEKKMSDFFRLNMNKQFDETEKKIQEKFTINFISNQLEYITLEPVIDFFNV